MWAEAYTKLGTQAHTQTQTGTHRHTHRRDRKDARMASVGVVN